MVTTFYTLARILSILFCNVALDIIAHRPSEGWWMRRSLVKPTYRRRKLLKNNLSDYRARYDGESEHHARQADLHMLSALARSSPHRFAVPTLRWGGLSRSMPCVPRSPRSISQYLVSQYLNISSCHSFPPDARITNTNKS